MERKNRYDGLDPSAVSSVRHHAKRLARFNAVPGMDVEDCEQELALHFLRRQEKYDEKRSSLPTFADRIIGNRSKSLVKPNKIRVLEQRMLSLDDVVESQDEDDITIQDMTSEDQSLWPNSILSSSDRMDLHIDLGRFIRDLPAGGRRCLAWLFGGGVEAAIRDGVHRSCFYDALERLRLHAHRHSLQEYLRD